MLPFPIINKTPVSPGTVVLDIDFNRQNIGDTSMIDAKGHVFTKNGVGSTVVQNDTFASKGHVMVFGTGAYFSTPMVNDLKLHDKKFELRVVYRSQSTSEQFLFSTGDYYSSGSIVGGMLLSLFNATGGTQLFCTDSTGTFTRCYYSYSVNTWRDISFIWTPGSNIMQIYDNDTKTLLQTYTVPAGFGDGTQFSVGGSYVRGTVGNLNGAIKSLKVTLLK